MNFNFNQALADKGRRADEELGLERLKINDAYQIGMINALKQIEEAKANVQLTQEEVKANVQLTQEEVRLSIAKLGEAGKIYAQLAASAMSAFNLSASTSYSDGKSISNSLGESYSASV